MIDNKCILSIVITSDSQTQELNRVLNSLCEQNSDDFEIICINNGFKKIDIDRINYYKAYVSKIKYINYENDKNIQEYACSCSKGEYILFLDYNIVFESGSIKELCSFLLNEQPDLCQIKINVRENNIFSKGEFEEFKHSVRLWSGVLKGEEILKKIYVEQKISSCLCNKIIKKSVLLKSFNEEVPGFYYNNYKIEEVIMFKIIYFSNKYYGNDTRIWANILPHSRELKYNLNYLKEESDKYLLYKNICECIEVKWEFSGYKFSKIILDLFKKNLLKIWITGDLDYRDKLVGLNILYDKLGAELLVSELHNWYNDIRIDYAHYIIMFINSISINEINPIAFCPKIAFITDDIIYIGYYGKDNCDYKSWNYVKFDNVQKNKFTYMRRFEQLKSIILKENIKLCIFDDKGKEAFWDIVALRLSALKEVVCVTNLEDSLYMSERYRILDTESYYKRILISGVSNVSIVPENINTAYLEKLNIRFGYTIEEALELLNKSEKIEESQFNEVCLSLLKNVYYQKLVNKNKLNLKLANAVNRYNKVVGAYIGIIEKFKMFDNIQRVIKVVVLLEFFYRSKWIEKLEIGLKILLKIFNKNVSLGLQTNGINNWKIKQYIRLFKENPYDFIAKINSRKKRSRYWEKRLCFGDENPNKIFYLIRMNPDGNEGILLIYLRYLRELSRIEKTKYIPIIDMEWAFYIMAHNDISETGKINAWELYFQPVTKYTLDSIKKSKNIIRGAVCYREQEDNYLRSNILRENSLENEADFRELCRIDSKYMKLKSDLKEKFEDEYLELIGTRRVIGVIIREGYIYLNKMNYELINNHPVQPNIDKVIDDLKKWMYEWNCDFIYISAEFEQTINKMKQAFGNRLIYTNRLRKSIEADSVTEYQLQRDRYYKSITREEINIDYLKEVYFLSRCTNLVCGRCSASIVAAIWNKGKYENRYIYELGKYSADKTKKIVSVTDKQ